MADTRGKTAAQAPKEKEKTMGELAGDAMVTLAKELANSLKTLAPEEARENLKTFSSSLLQPLLNGIKTNEEKKSFRRNLLSNLHPDRIEKNLDKSIIDYYTKETLFQMVEEILDAACQQSVSDQIFSTPDLANLFSHIRHINRLKRKESTEENQRLIARARKSAKEMFPGFGLLLRMGENLDRYFQPLNFLFQRIIMGFLLSGLGNIISGIRFIPAVLRLIPLGLIALNILLFMKDDKNSEFQKKADKFTHKAFNESSIPHSFSPNIEFIDRDGDAELILQKIEEKIGTIRAFGGLFLFGSQRIAGMPLLELMLLGYYERLFRSLPEGFLYPIATIFLFRPLEFVLAAVLLAAATGVEILNALVDAARYIAAMSVLLVAGVASFALNSLLFIYDAPGYVMSKCCGCSPEEPEEVDLSKEQKKKLLSTNANVHFLTAANKSVPPPSPRSRSVAGANTDTLPDDEQEEWWEQDLLLSTQEAQFGEGSPDDNTSHARVPAIRDPLDWGLGGMGIAQPRNQPSLNVSVVPFSLLTQPSRETAATLQHRQYQNPDDHVCYDTPASTTPGGPTSPR